MPLDYLVIVAEPDPVASAVAEPWGTPDSIGVSVDGVPIRALSPRVGMLKRATRHIHDDGLDRSLPEPVRAVRPTLVFPSIHRSERNVASLTVHPLGNPGPSAVVGGRPRTLVPTDPRRMADALRRLGEAGASLGIPATYEATHHGPALELPAFFVEIGFGAAPGPSPDAVAALSVIVPRLTPDPSDRVALAVGGGHYAPHFTDLARKRRWAFGHLLSRHSLESLDPTTARAALEQSPGAEGIVYARAEDAEHPAFRDLGPRRRDADAAVRERIGAPTAASRWASGT